ncbi:MAG: PEP-CTERM sorting domain-containing protein [Phycisphaeraceae bacterium]
MTHDSRFFPAALGSLLVCAGLMPGPAYADGTLKIVLMAGQSNNVGHARTFYEGTTGDSPYRLEYLADNPAVVSGLDAGRYSFKDHFEANWMQPRDDAWGLHIASSSGGTQVIKPTPRTAADRWVQGVAPLGPGFGNDINTLSKIGPELALGHYLADRTDDPVFIFKSDTGGTTLAQDWRPPTAAATRPQNGDTVGMHYTATMDRFTAFLDELDADLADDGRLNDYMDATGYEVSALVWFHGFNEAVEAGGAFKPEYEANLVDLVRDVRNADARIPGDLGAIIPESSDQDFALNTARQAAVDTLNLETPNSAVFFRNNDLLDTRPLGYHFHESAESYLEIGWRMGTLGAAVLDPAFAGPGTTDPHTLPIEPVEPGTPGASVGFEAPRYAIGPWSSQQGGGIVWWEWNADATGHVVAGGYNSPQAARLGADERANPQSGEMESDGGDMLAFFEPVENIVLTAMSYAHLNPSPDNNGTPRKAWFLMSGSGIVWGDNGNILARAGGNQTDTGVPIVYDQWVSFEIHIDHATQDVVIYYDGQEVLSANAGGNSAFSDNFNTWLDTIKLSDNPDPDDYFLLDDITIVNVPEPNTLALVGAGVALIGRRRR